MADTDWISKLNELQGSGSVADALKKAFLLPPIAFLLTTADALEAIVSFFVDVPIAFINGLVNVAFSILGGEGFTGVSGILDAAASASAESISFFGFFSFPAGVAVVLMAGLILSWYLSREDTSDTLPFSFTDIPIIGTEEE